jgi:hypothetical protein
VFTVFLPSFASCSFAISDTSFVISFFFAFILLFVNAHCTFFCLDFALDIISFASKMSDIVPNGSATNVSWNFSSDPYCSATISNHSFVVNRYARSDRLSNVFVCAYRLAVARFINDLGAFATILSQAIQLSHWNQYLFTKFSKLEFPGSVFADDSYVPMFSKSSQNPFSCSSM